MGPARRLQRKWQTSPSLPFGLKLAGQPASTRTGRAGGPPSLHSAPARSRSTMEQLSIAAMADVTTFAQLVKWAGLDPDSALWAAASERLGSPNKFLDVAGISVEEFEAALTSLKVKVILISRLLLPPAHQVLTSRLDLLTRLKLLHNFVSQIVQPIIFP